jgi:hypothetical protein
VSRDDREAPRLQDTTERSALPLPLPGSEESGQAGLPTAAADPEPPADPDPPVDAEPPADPGPPAGDASAEAPPPPPVPPIQPDPTVAGIAGEAGDSGPSPEVLIGAAFAGGLALAILLRRLGR